MKKLFSILCLFISISFIFPVSIFASSFTDTFNDIDGTPLPSHNDVWECLINSSSIYNNEARSDNGDSYCISNNIWADGYAQITANIVSSYGRMRILARNNTYPNQYVCDISPLGSNILKGSEILASSAIAISTGIHTLKCETSGNTITEYYDGVQILQVSDSSISSGNAGFFLDGANATYDNWYSCDGECASIVTPTPTLESTPIPVMPIKKDECKKNGWIDFINWFKNQGLCVSFTNK